MKKAFEPVKLRESSRKRVLRDLIRYNELKSEQENVSDSISKKNEAINMEKVRVEDTKGKVSSSRELKPRKRKKTFIIMEALAAAAVIALIIGTIAVSVSQNKTNTTQSLSGIESKGDSQQNISQEDNSQSDNSQKEALPSGSPALEFVSSEKLGVSIAFNSTYFYGYDINSDGSILFYNEDYAMNTETGLSYNTLEVSGLKIKFTEAVDYIINSNTSETGSSIPYTLIGNDKVFIGSLYYDNFISTNADTSSAASSCISATKLTFSYELPDISTTECKEVYLIDFSGFDGLYDTFAITVTYHIFNNGSEVQYSIEPEVICDIIDTFSIETYTKKTFYILAENYHSDDTKEAVTALNNFQKLYSENSASNEGIEQGIEHYYAIMASTETSAAQADYKIILPVGSLYDAAGTRDTNTDYSFYSTFEDSVAIDLYYPYSYNEGGDDGEDLPVIYPSYGVLHSEFKNDEETDIFGNSSAANGTQTYTQSFVIYPQDTIISINNDNCIIFGRSDNFESMQKDYGEEYNYDYVIYVPFEKIYDEKGNAIGKELSQISSANPSLTMTVYFDGAIQETFPAQINADEVIIHGIANGTISNGTKQ